MAFQLINGVQNYLRPQAHLEEVFRIAPDRRATVARGRVVTAVSRRKHVLHAGAQLLVHTDVSIHAQLQEGQCSFCCGGFRYGQRGRCR